MNVMRRFFFFQLRRNDCVLVFHHPSRERSERFTRFFFSCLVVSCHGMMFFVFFCFLFLSLVTKWFVLFGQDGARGPGWDRRDRAWSSPFQAPAR